MHKIHWHVDDMIPNNKIYAWIPEIIHFKQEDLTARPCCDIQTKTEMVIINQRWKVEIHPNFTREYSLKYEGEIE